MGLNAKPNKRFGDLQLRHTLDLSASTRLSFGLEHVHEIQRSESYGIGQLQSSDAAGSALAGSWIVFGGNNDIRRTYSSLELGARHRLAPAWLLDLNLNTQRLRERINGESATLLEGLLALQQTQVQTQQTSRHTSPRLGLVYQPSDAFSLRAAYQDWVRPLSVSTLGAVDTAGIALEDRLLVAVSNVVCCNWAGRPMSVLS